MLPLFAFAADTVLVRQVPPLRTGFEQTVFVAAGLAQILTLVVVVLLALIFHRMWKAQQGMQDQLGRLSAKVDPMIASATAAAENVRALTAAVKEDAAEAAGKLNEATSRVRDSVTGIADRIDEFGALLGRVHQKADAVVDVAGAAVESIKWGVRALGPRRRRKKRPVRDVREAPRDAEPSRLLDPDLDDPEAGAPRRRRP